MPVSSAVLVKLEALVPTSRTALESWSWSLLQAHAEVRCMLRDLTDIVDHAQGLSAIHALQGEA